MAGRGTDIVLGGNAEHLAKSLAEQKIKDGEDVQNLRQVARRAQREPAMPRDVDRRLAGRGKLLGNFVGIGRRCEPREALLAGGRERKGADRLDDAIEFEGPQGS